MLNILDTIIKEMVLADVAYQNACVNSDKETAYLEGKSAILRAVRTIEDLTFQKQFFDNATFYTRLHHNILDCTYPLLSQSRQEHEQDKSGDDLDTVPYNFELEYRMLSRLKSDCDYFLGAGGRAQKHLSEGGIEAQIAKMWELYDGFPADMKPEWLTAEDIDRYEAQMQAGAVTTTIPNYEATVTAEEAPLLARLLANRGIDAGQFVHDSGEVTFSFAAAVKDVVEKLIAQVKAELSKAVSATRAAAAPKKPGRSRPELNYRNFVKMFPEIASGEYRYLRMESGPSMMPLHLEWIGRDEISISHTFAHNGDLMRDPEMTFRVNRDKGTLEPLTFQQDGSLQLYQEVYPEPGRWIPKLSRDLSRFAQQWLNNISQQHYHKHEAIAVRNGENVNLTFHPDGNVQEPAPVVQPKPAAPEVEPSPARDPLAPAYQEGDTVYIESKPFIISRISPSEIQLQYPNAKTPIFTSEAITRFEYLLRQDPRNKAISEYLSTDTDRIRNDTREILTAHLLSADARNDISRWFRFGEGNSKIAERFSEIFSGRSGSAEVPGNVTAQYSADARGFHVTHPLYAGFETWEQVAAILRSLWQRELDGFSHEVPAVEHSAPEQQDQAGSCPTRSH